MSALLTINAPLRGAKITVRFDGSKHNGACITNEFVEQTWLHFDVKEIEPGEPESIVIDVINEFDMKGG